MKENDENALGYQFQSYAVDPSLNQKCDHCFKEFSQIKEDSGGAYLCNECFDFFTKLSNENHGDRI